MGTRGAWGFRNTGKDKLTYNHFDSYITGLGQTVLEFIKETDDDEIREIAERIILVKKDTEASPEQIQECRAIANLEVSTGSEKEWYCLLRNSQGAPSLYKFKRNKIDINADDAFDFKEVKPEVNKNGLRYMIDSHDFMKDSLFCEYAYVLNCDNQSLEIYLGFNQKAGGKGRYAKGKSNEDGYYGVSLFKTIPFSEIRKIDDIEKYCESLVSEIKSE